MVVGAIARAAGVRVRERKKRFNHKEHKGHKLWDGYSCPIQMI